jgi:hypothetical protein
MITLSGATSADFFSSPSRTILARPSGNISIAVGVWPASALSARLQDTDWTPKHYLDFLLIFCSRPAAIFGNELDTGRFERSADGTSGA